MLRRITVYLPEDVLKRLDAEARESCTSRSAVVAHSIEHYLEHYDKERKRQRQRRAAASMDRLREEVGGWDGPAEIINGGRCIKSG